MVELADTQDLGSCASQRAGSTPVTRTTGSMFSLHTGPRAKEITRNVMQGRLGNLLVT